MMIPAQRTPTPLLKYEKRSSGLACQAWSYTLCMALPAITGIEGQDRSVRPSTLSAPEPSNLDPQASPRSVARAQNVSAPRSVHHDISGKIARDLDQYRYTRNLSQVVVSPVSRVIPSGNTRPLYTRHMVPGSTSLRGETCPRACLKPRMYRIPASGTS